MRPRKTRIGDYIAATEVSETENCGTNHRALRRILQVFVTPTAISGKNPQNRLIIVRKRPALLVRTEKAPPFLLIQARRASE
jgi:hypothetical protein|tara:strand:- start:485 stop:730 length:246 start_codon:yes stop_codon:yes gene_type:complete